MKKTVSFVWRGRDGANDDVGVVSDGMIYHFEEDDPRVAKLEKATSTLGRFEKVTAKEAKELAAKAPARPDPFATARSLSFEIDHEFEPAETEEPAA